MESIVSFFINQNIMEIPKTLNINIGVSDGKFIKRNEFDELKKYIDEFIEGKKINRFIVLPGIRGVGKTTLLYQVYEYLIKEKNIPINQVLYTSCEDLNDLTECSLRQLADIFLEQHHTTTLRLLSKPIFLLIDESQFDKNWAISGKIIFDRTKNVFMIMTGSSALESEINADIDRRTIKTDLIPLTYSHHLKLRYNINLNHEDFLLLNMILTGNVGDAINKEQKINNFLINNLDYTDNDWIQYLYYGAFPIYFEEDENSIIRNKIIRIVKKVVESDIPNIKNISQKNKTYANRILNYLALLDSAEVSMNKLSNYLNTAVGNVETILKLLEQTHLIFHLEAYGTPSFRQRKAFKYYFATSSIKYALFRKSGNYSKDIRKFEGVLIENTVALKLFELIKVNDNISLFYDAGKKGNVDFLLKEENSKVIPIEVGRGKKDNKQIKNAIKNYNADYGIIISDTTTRIVKEDNIIYIPVKTFALL